MSKKILSITSAMSLMAGIAMADVPGVAVDIAPVHSLVSKVMEGVAKPKLLIPAGASPHEYRLKPSDATSLQDSSMVFWIGEDLTPWLEKSLNTLAKDAAIISLLGAEGSKVLDFREGALFDAHDHGDHDDHDDHDDHAKKKDHDDHGHGDHGFEWAGAFELSAGTYKWSFAKVDGQYADPAMKMLILDADSIESSEEKAEELLESKDTEVKRDNEELVVQDKAYVLNFDDKKENTVFTVEIKKDGKYVFFTEHMPFEFESNEHFFKDAAGNDVEPVAQEPDSGHHDHAKKEDHDDHDEHGHGAHDPHAWLSPENAKVWLNLIASKLSGIDPDNAGTYFANASSARTELDKLSKEVSKILDPIRGKNFIVFHDAYQYFEQDFNISAAGAISMGDASDPSPARLAEIRKRVADESVSCVLAEPQYKKGLVNAVVEGTNAGTGVIDPLGSGLKTGPSLYNNLIRNMALVLSKCQ